MGVCSYKIENNHYPFEFIISKYDDTANTIEGTVTWHTLGTKTKIRGKISEFQFEFEEYEIVTGDPDSIELPVNYQGRIEGKVMKGQVLLKDMGAEEVTFKIDCLFKPKIEPIRNGQKWKSDVFNETYEAKLVVESRDANKITGHYLFQNGSKINITGLISGTTLTIEETESKKLLYTAVLSDPASTIGEGKHANGTYIKLDLN